MSDDEGDGYGEVIRGRLRRAMSVQGIQKPDTNGCTWTSEFWLDENLDQDDFVRAFEARFSGSRAEHLPVVPDANPGYKLFHLHIPYEQRDELFPYLEQYAREHNSDFKTSQATSFPFCPES